MNEFTVPQKVDCPCCGSDNNLSVNPGGRDERNGNAQGPGPGGAGFRSPGEVRRQPRLGENRVWLGGSDGKLRECVDRGLGDRSGGPGLRAGSQNFGDLLSAPEAVTLRADEELMVWVDTSRDAVILKVDSVEIGLGSIQRLDDGEVRELSQAAVCVASGDQEIQ